MARCCLTTARVEGEGPSRPALTSSQRDRLATTRHRAASVCLPPTRPAANAPKSLVSNLRCVTTVSEVKGRSTITYLIEAGRLERIVDEGRTEAGDWLLGQAERRLATAIAGLDLGDITGAFAVAYDAYRMSAESLLLRQCLRPTSGEGSHVAVEDAVSAQFADSVSEFAKPTFERLRRKRHAAQYYDDTVPPPTSDDARWAISVAKAAVDRSKQIGAADALGPFNPDQG